MRIRLAVIVALTAACSSSGGRRNSLIDGDVKISDTTGVSDVAQEDGTVAIDGSDAAGDIDEPDLDVVSDASADGSDVEAPFDVIAPDTGGELIPVQGSLLIIQVETTQVQSASVTASFVTELAPGQPPIATEGDCQLFAAAGPTTPPALPSYDAGAISLTGLMTPVTLTPGPAAGGKVLYTSGLSSSVQTVIGTSAKVKATATGGKDLPGFTVEAGVPKLVSVTKPTQDDKLGASSDLTVTWGKDVASLVRVDLFVYDVGQQKAASGPVILCNLTGDTGSVVVKSALLKKLPDLGAGLFGPNGYLVVGVTRVNTAEVPLSGGKVSLGISRTGGTAAAFDP